jgi:hypothetical protein
MTTEPGGASARDRIARALASPDPRIKRLAAADTSVTFVNLDAPDASVTLLLDRYPPVATGGDEPAEITIELTGQQYELFSRGAFSLPAALMAGQAGYRGPVRKYLAVDPVLRGLLEDLDLFTN